METLQEQVFEAYYYHQIKQADRELFLTTLQASPKLEEAYFNFAATMDLISENEPFDEHNESLDQQVLADFSRHITPTERHKAEDFIEAVKNNNSDLFRNNLARLEAYYTSESAPIASEISSPASITNPSRTKVRQLIPRWLLAAAAAVLLGFIGINYFNSAQVNWTTATLVDKTTYEYVALDLKRISDPKSSFGGNDPEITPNVKTARTHWSTALDAIIQEDFVTAQTQLTQAIANDRRLEYELALAGVLTQPGATQDISRALSILDKLPNNKKHTYKVRWIKAVVYLESGEQARRQPAIDYLQSIADTGFKPYRDYATKYLKEIAHE